MGPEADEQRDPTSATVGDIARRVERITRENQALFTRLIDGERRFRRLAKAVWMVQEDERRRLARELHDGIGQTLTALKNQLDRLRRDAGEGELSDRLGESFELAAIALNDTRELSRLLRPAVLDDLGLDAALQWLARTMGGRSGLNVTLECELEDQRFAQDVETLVFRLVQEGLTNIVKHAGVRAARVRVHHTDTALEVSVEDDGNGFDPKGMLTGAEYEQGVGLRGMRDRAELFGGVLDIDSHPGRGTRIAVFIPLASTERNAEQNATETDEP